MTTVGLILLFLLTPNYSGAQTCVPFNIGNCNAVNPFGSPAAGAIFNTRSILFNGAFGLPSTPSLNDIEAEIQSLLAAGSFEEVQQIIFSPLGQSLQRSDPGFAERIENYISDVTSRELAYLEGLAQGEFSGLIGDRLSVLTEQLRVSGGRSAFDQLTNLASYDLNQYANEMIDNITALNLREALKIEESERLFREMYDSALQQLEDVLVSSILGNLTSGHRELFPRLISYNIDTLNETFERNQDVRPTLLDDPERLNELIRARDMTLSEAEIQRLVQEKTESHVGDYQVDIVPSPRGDGLFSHGDCRTIWQPSSQDVANMRWSGRDGDQQEGGNARVHYDANTDSMRITQLPNVSSRGQLSDSKGALNGSSRPFATGNVGIMTTQIYLHPGWEGNPGGRFAIKMFGSSTPNARGLGGGTKANDQGGWSFRVQYSNSGQPRMYAYNLNRLGGTEFGYGPRLSDPLPRGQWLTVAIEVRLNSVGRSDGHAIMKIFDEQGRLYQEGRLNNMVWRNDPSWNGFGVYLTDKIAAEPRRPQYTLYRDYRFSVGSGNSCMPS